MKLDVRDWFIMSMLAGIAIVGGVYVFKHPDDVNFGTWGTVCGVLTAALHWLNVRDDKEKDQQ